MILVTGGAGFIGSNFILDWLAQSNEPVINLDKLTYAGNLNNLLAVRGRAEHIFVQADICDTAKVAELLNTHKPRAIVHFHPRPWRIHPHQHQRHLQLVGSRARLLVGVAGGRESSFPLPARFHR